MPAAYDLGKLLPASNKDGWRLGLIGLPWPGPWPKRSGDLFVSAPNGDPAGIAWESGGPDILRISEPSELHWGVFQLRFTIEVMGPEDLVRNFHAVLSLLQREYATHRSDRSGRPAPP